MDTIQDILQRSHERHKKSLRQRKTLVTPALYNMGHPYHVTVHCAYKYPVVLANLEEANISFMPIGRAPENDRGPRELGGERFLKRQGIEDWGMRRWHDAWGIQVYTGIPSERDGAQWHDFNFTYKALCTVPDEILKCLEVLIDAVPNPLLTMTKSGGLRFTCRIPDYLHSNSNESQLYIYQHKPTTDNPHEHDVYLKIVGKEGYSRWDARYEVLLGNLLDPPVIDKEVVFAPIDALRVVLHEPTPKKLKQKELVADVPLSLGSLNLDHAKEAFVKRGYSYVCDQNGSHLWSPTNSGERKNYILLWESEGVVWIRATGTGIDVPTISTEITEVWDDTGIIPLEPPIDMSITESMLAVRNGQLSPLAIKRSASLLNKSDQPIKKVDTSKEDNTDQKIFEQACRILGVIAEGGTENSHDTESYVRNGGATCLNLRTYKNAEKLENQYENRNLELYQR